ncbi:hypothetical protein Dimus_033310 [Dionaea muscipula]
MKTVQLDFARLPACGMTGEPKPWAKFLCFSSGQAGFLKYRLFEIFVTGLQFPKQLNKNKTHSFWGRVFDDFKEQNGENELMRRNRKACELRMQHIKADLKKWFATLKRVYDCPRSGQNLHGIVRYSNATDAISYCIIDPTHSNISTHWHRNKLHMHFIRANKTIRGLS